jgi:hypothetical protein
MKNPVICSDLSEVLAPVNAIEALTLFKNEKIVLPRGHEKAIISGNTIFGYVSENFGLIKPMDVFSTFSEEFEKFGLSFEPLGRIDNRGNWELRFKFDNPEFSGKYGKEVGDEVFGMLAFGGGLAGSRSSYINDMAYRKTCSNGRHSLVSQILMDKVRNTKNNHASKFGIDFQKLLPLVEVFINNHSYIEEQKRLIDMPLKQAEILPFFYEATKGTNFAESKFQTAFDRMKLEAKQLGYTEMNRYLAYNGLNYILEHDSLALNLVQTKETDMLISSRVETLDLALAIKNFDTIALGEKTRLENYARENEGKSPRGKRKVLELV